MGVAAAGRAGAAVVAGVRRTVVVGAGVVTRVVGAPVAAPEDPEAFLAVVAGLDDGVTDEVLGDCLAVVGVEAGETVVVGALDVLVATVVGVDVVVGVAARATPGVLSASAPAEAATRNNVRGVRAGMREPSPAIDRLRPNVVTLVGDGPRVGGWSRRTIGRWRPVHRTTTGICGPRLG